MALHLAIPFPTEAETWRRQAHLEQAWTPTQRLLAVVDTLSAAETLSYAGAVRARQLKYQEALEREWQMRMKEFINQHVAT